MRVHLLLREMCNSPRFAFVDELATSNGDYRHIDRLRKSYFMDSFAFIGDYARMLQAERTLFIDGNHRVAASYGFYRRVVPEIVATGKEVYYCANKSWVIGTKRKEVKQTVLKKFEVAVLNQSERDGFSFFEPFYERYLNAIWHSLKSTGLESLWFQCSSERRRNFDVEGAAERESALGREVARKISPAYEQYVRENDWSWIRPCYDSDEEASAMLESDVQQKRQPFGTFCSYEPLSQLLSETMRLRKMRKYLGYDTTDFYPICCKDVAFLPFGTHFHISSRVGGIYMDALSKAAGKWLNEVAEPWEWKRGRKKQ